MNTFTQKLEGILMPIATKISSIKALQAVSNGFMRILPVTIIGSVFYLIVYFPITAWTNMISKNGLQAILLIAYNITLGLLALYTAFAVAYCYVAEEKGDALGAGIISLICFLILTPYTMDKAGNYLYDFGFLGSKGLFVALITAIIVAKVVSAIVRKGWTIKMPEGVPPYVERSFASLIPALICAALFTLIFFIFKQTPYGNIHNLVYKFLQTPLTALGGSLGGYIIATILIQLLWWFGIHGFNVVMSVLMPVYLSIDMARLAGTTHNPVGMSLMTVVGQSTICCCIIMIFFCKSNQLRQIGKIATPAAIFNIGEPIVFGVPNVLNPYMFIPTVILVPVITNLFFYFGFASGIVPMLSGAQIPMQMPVILYGLVQGNWMCALWQAIAIPLGVILYLPFYKMYDKTLCKKEAAEKAENA